MSSTMKAGVSILAAGGAILIVAWLLLCREGGEKEEPVQLNPSKIEEIGSDESVPAVTRMEPIVSSHPIEEKQPPFEVEENPLQKTLHDGPGVPVPSGDAGVPLGMVEVPAGEVRLGLGREEILELGQGRIGNLDILSRSFPRHIATVKSAFYCDLFEVTKLQYLEFLARTNKAPSKNLVQYTWNKAFSCPTGQNRFPVGNVDYSEACAFARWCGKRLPTETEWMRAAAGEDGRSYAWGNEWLEGEYCKNPGNVQAPVGSHPEGRSPFGIFDMTGSLWEWTASALEPFEGWESIDVSLTGAHQPLEATPGFNGRCKVVKGGHYLLGGLQNLLQIREGIVPSGNLDSLGFRCVKDKEPGMTMLGYALADLKVLEPDRKLLDLQNRFYLEETRFIEDESPVIGSFDYLLLVGMDQPLWTLEETLERTRSESVIFGLISFSRPAEDPELPPGSYLLAYRRLPVEGEAAQEREEVLLLSQTKTLLRAVSVIQSEKETWSCRIYVEYLSASDRFKLSPCLVAADGKALRLEFYLGIPGLGG